MLALALSGCAGGYTVTFDTQGGTRVGGGELKQTVAKGKSAVAPELERSGYIFCNWNDTLTPESGDKTVCALWKRAYKVKFNPTGGTVVSGESEQLVGAEEAAEPPEVKREGYVFEGWDSDYSNIKMNLIVNAKWAGTCLVTFDANGGEASGAETVQSVNKGGSATPPEVKREGYTFAGWDGAFTNVAQDIKVTAKWSKTHTVTFDINGGTFFQGALVQQVEDGGAASAPYCRKDGCDFLGWSEDFGAVYSDMTLRAIWSEAEYAPTELYRTASKATIEVNTYNEVNKSDGLGSGFFIDTQGTVLTNFHVLAGAHRAEVKLSDGRTCNVTQILGYDISRDLAIAKTDIGESPCLTLSERGVQTGENIYTLGSARGLPGTFADGIVSTASRTVVGIECIQISAPISTGNSGGPLLNAYGEVVGVNSLTIASGQNLNFAINIREFYKVSTASPLSVERFYEETYFNGSRMFKTILDEMEPNNSTKNAQIVLPGHTVNARFAVGTDVDCFKIIRDEETELNVLLVPQGADAGSIVCQLVNESGSVIASAEQCGPMGNTDALRLSVADADEELYYVRCYVKSKTTEPVYYIMHIY